MSNNIVQLNEEIIKGQLKELVRGSVEETLNEMLEASGFHSDRRSDSLSSTVQVSNLHLQFAEILS